MKVNCLKKTVLTSISGASGVEVVNGCIYIVADNAAMLYQLNHDLEVLSKIELPYTFSEAKEHIPKPNKPDLECICSFEINGYPHLLILSSGSLSPQRDTGYLIKLPSPYNKNHLAWPVQVKPLYDFLRSNEEVTSSGEVNFEGLATNERFVYLLNRGNTSGCKNVVLQFNKTEFVEFVQGHMSGIPFPKIFLHEGDMIEQQPAYFTGADCAHDYLFYTASAEDTANAYDDGTVHGSIIGYFCHKRKYTNRYYVDFLLHQQTCVMKTEDEFYRPKVESISIYEKENPGKYVALAVTDSDGGQSELLMLEIIL
ncbi:MAG: hypothetical protein NZ529_07225 [Cytophagaceae bacterium]|nr:hypothetical protein [Cytophagaceae bacterium]MDW8456574.1 hypothetical protein [Cytophagaceae bacterium]